MKLNEHRYPDLTALEEFEEGLRVAFAAGGGTLLRPRPDLLHVLEPEGDTYIYAVPVPVAAQQEGEPKPISQVTITSVLKDRPRLTDEQINTCNRYAGLSLMSRQPGQPEVMAANALTVYDDPVQRSQALYLGRQVAVLQRTWLSQVLGALEDDFRRGVAVLDPLSAREPSRWADKELESMLKAVIEADHRARQSDSHGFVIHLSKTKVRGQGSFVIVRNDFVHPFYGNGLSVTLVLPEESGVSREQLELRALEWNRREALSIMPTPCIGAWSSVFGRSQMQHQCFVPNVIYSLGIGQWVVDGTIQRWAVSGDPGESV